MESRRAFLKTSAAGLAAALAGVRPARAQGAARQPMPRFIFLRKSNGTSPAWLVPPSLSDADKQKDAAKGALELDLDRHELPGWMQPIGRHKKNLTILQGLSAKMCTMGHATYQSPLAVCRSAERSATIKRATVDVELGRMFPSPFGHIELTCAKNEKGVVRGMSSIGPQQPNYAFASPSAAFENLFLLASTNQDKLTDQKLENNLLAFLSRNVEREAREGGKGSETRALGAYGEAAQALIGRNAQLESMAERIRKHAPKLDDGVMKDQYTTTEQQRAFAEILVSSLQAGLSNVITFTLDDLATLYTGLYEFPVNLHDVGHNKETGGVPALDVRTKLRTHHMTLVDAIVDRLKKTPEGDGSMFDRTILMYFPENGEAHHSVGTEVPFVILAGEKAKLDLGGRYIRLPDYDQAGHKTLGNWYTTVLNAYGNPVKHYGDFDVALKIDQAGPIRRFMA